MRNRVIKEKPSARSARLPLNAIRVFEAVAIHRSFSEAAEALHVTTAAVSMQIKSLEEYLQTQLFRRGRRDVQITADGDALLPYVRRGLDEIELGFRAIKSARDGTLVVSLLVSFLQRWLLPRMPEFHASHPQIDLQFRTSTSLVDFARSDVHAAIRFGHGEWPGLHAERILDDWLVVVCTPAFLKRHGPLRSQGSTGSYALLHSSTEPWAIWTEGKDERRDDGGDVWPAGGTAFNNSAVALQAAEQGQGLALARWSLASSAVMSGALVLAYPHALLFSRSYYFVCPESYLNLPKVAEFRGWIVSAAANAPKPPVKVNPRSSRGR